MLQDLLLSDYFPTSWMLLLLATVLCVLYYRSLTTTFSTWSSQGIPGPKPYPMFGTSLETIKAGNFAPIDLEYVKRYGKIVGTYNGSQPVLLVSDPEFLRKAAIKEFNRMPNRRFASFGSTMDLFLTILNDEHWRHVRNSLTPTFTTGKLKQMKPALDECCELMMKYMEEHEGTALNCKDVAGGFSMSAIASTNFGVDVNSYENPNDQFIVYANKLVGKDPEPEKDKTKKMFKGIAFAIVLNMVPARFWPYLPKIGLDLFSMDAFSYYTKLTDKILANRTTEKSGRKDYVQLCMNQLIPDPKADDPDTLVDDRGYLWSHKGLTRDEIVAMGVQFFLGGYETTANALHYAMYELALDQHVQQKLYDEIMSSFPGDEKPSYGELSELVYLDCVISEVLRLYPALPRLERRVSQATVIDGITLPVGSLLSMQAYSIHHDPELWPNPFQFDPDRHRPENKEGRHPCAWLPFGIGQRNCIGMRLALLELKIVLVEMLRRFKLEPCTETVQKPIVYAKNFQHVPATPLKVVARRRAGNI